MPNNLFRIRVKRCSALRGKLAGTYVCEYRPGRLTVDGTRFSLCEDIRSAKHFSADEATTVQAEFTEIHFQTEVIPLQTCRCGHSREDHEPAFSRCDGWDETQGLPVVPEGQLYPPVPQCNCKKFDLHDPA